MDYTTFVSSEKLYDHQLNDNFSIINSNTTTLFGSGVVNGTLNAPIGTIIAWLYNLTGTPSLPSGWGLCDGINGRPDLRSDIFLRGTSGTTGLVGGANTHNHEDSARFGGNSTSYAHDVSTEDNQPPYYTVVFIIKIGV